MGIKEIRDITGLSQTAFGKKYGIGLRTIQHWEEGTRKCPSYVENLLERAVKEDCSVNTLSVQSSENADK